MKDISLWIVQLFAGCRPGIAGCGMYGMLVQVPVQLTGSLIFCTRLRRTDGIDLHGGWGCMPGCSSGKIFLHMRLCDMVIEMLPALPFFDEVIQSRDRDIGEQFIAGTAGLLSYYRHDLPGFADKIPQMFGNNGTLCINKYHLSSPFRSQLFLVFDEFIRIVMLLTGTVSPAPGRRR